MTSTRFGAAIEGDSNDGAFEIGTAMTEALWGSVSVRPHSSILKKS
jgi:hypothetical protein